MCSASAYVLAVKIRTTRQPQPSKMRREKVQGKLLGACRSHIGLLARMVAFKDGMWDGFLGPGHPCCCSRKCSRGRDNCCAINLELKYDGAMAHPKSLRANWHTRCCIRCGGSISGGYSGEVKRQYVHPLLPRFFLVTNCPPECMHCYILTSIKVPISLCMLVGICSREYAG